MKHSKMNIMLVFILLFGTIFAPTVYAANVGGKKLKIVSLGDSITYGWNLDEDKSKPSEKAFPNLIGERDHKVTNLSKPGMTSSQLLAAMELDTDYGDAIRKADIITLNIGSNDLLQTTGIMDMVNGKIPFDRNTVLANYPLAVAQLKVNLNSIIENIRSKTDAPIILYTLYNPFGFDPTNPLAVMLYGLGQQILPQVNQFSIAPQAKAGSILIADAFSAYDGNQAAYILPNDIHPTVEGQVVLAKLAEEQIVELGDKRLKLKFSK
ncbi:SGNH/GDSL hydrolase family protein [Neobacillus sp. YIM B06451]|uniref:SGNH/GDSL hydrolase family protein n=1 Tax=Neobacillus sp. YIM B06451 TaxID=3070994 RepID=UPI00292DFD5A|nr:SGNH/GDSL hydrolase family protein [Neobacillus sp. YIM B06451]